MKKVGNGGNGIDQSVMNDYLKRLEKCEKKAKKARKLSKNNAETINEWKP